MSRPIRTLLLLALWAGAKFGAVTGGEVGSLFWGVGAFPGMLVGGVIGGIGFGLIGSEVAGVAINELHN